MPANRVVLAEYFATDDRALLFLVRADFEQPTVVEIETPLQRIREFVAEHFGTDHRQILVDPDRMLPAVDAAIVAMNEPMVSVRLEEHAKEAYWPGGRDYDVFAGPQGAAVEV